MPVEPYYPKHPNLFIDESNRICMRRPDGVQVALTSRIGMDSPLASDVMKRLVHYRSLQTSLASALLVVKKLMHSKRKSTALNDADHLALDEALANLRFSRGLRSSNTTPSTSSHGLAFIEAIDKTFKEVAEATAAAPTEG